MTSSGAAGRRLGRYHLSEPLGGGPTGEVFRAKVYGVAGFERQFAVKRFHAEFVRDPAVAAEVATAARMYGSLEHPRIARLNEYGVSGGETFTATEMVTGIDLARLIAITGEGEPLVAGAVAALVSQIARAVGYAHGRGISHFGICPTNLICNVDGDVKVTDFGFLPPRLPPRPANDYSLQARIPYLSPEQLANEPTSAATDVFQLGVVACELFNGRHCFTGPTPFEIAQEILSGKPPALDLPKPLIKVLHRCLARSPFERFPDAGALADALDAATRTTPLPGDRRDVSTAVRQALQRLAEMNEQQISGALHFPLPAPPPGPVPGPAAVPPDPAAGPPSIQAPRPPPVPSVPAPARPAVPSPRAVTPLAKLLQGAARSSADRESAPELVEEATIPRRTLLGVVAPDGEEDAPTQVRARDGFRSDSFSVPDGHLPTPPPIIEQGHPTHMPAPPPLTMGEIANPEPAHHPAEPPAQAPPIDLGEFDGGYVGEDLVGPLGGTDLGDLEFDRPIELGSEPRRLEPPLSPPFPIAQLPPDGPVPPARPKRARGGLLFALALVAVAAGGFVLYDQVLAGSGDSTSKPGPAGVATRPDGGPRTAAAPSDGGTSADAAARAATAGIDAAPTVLLAVAPPDAATVEPPVDPSEGPDSDGQLVIRSTPTGSQVYLDGALKGETPVTVEGVRDRQSLAVIKPGYKLHLAEIEGRGRVEVTLVEVNTPAGPAGIKVRCKEKNRFYVFVDGNDIGQLCPTERIGVEMGDHVVEIYDPITEQRHSFQANVKQTRNSVRVRVD